MGMSDRPSPGAGLYIVIPATVLHDARLTLFARLLYGELAALANARGYAWISNQGLASRYGVSKRTVITAIGSLTELDYIRTEVEYDENGAVTQRRIYILSHIEAFVSEVSEPARKSPVSAVEDSEEVAVNPCETGEEGGGEENFTPLVKKISPPPCRNFHQGGEEIFTPVIKINNKDLNNPPIVPPAEAGGTSESDFVEEDLKASLSSIARQAGVRVRSPRPREVKALSEVCEKLPVDRVLEVARFAWSDPFWKARLFSLGAFARNFAMLDAQRQQATAAKRGSVPIPVDPSRPVKVTSAKRLQVPIFSFAKLTLDPVTGQGGLEKARAHLDGEVPVESCSVCAVDERNRSTHAPSPDSSGVDPRFDKEAVR